MQYVHDGTWRWISLLQLSQSHDIDEYKIFAIPASTFIFLANRDESAVTSKTQNFFVVNECTNFEDKKWFEFCGKTRSFLSSAMCSIFWQLFALQKNSGLSSSSNLNTTSVSFWEGRVRNPTFLWKKRWLRFILFFGGSNFKRGFWQLKQEQVRGGAGELSELIWTLIYIKASRMLIF